MNPIASVIVPVHNGARFVRTAIASALAQTCSEIEIIVVDDGSTDNTWDVVGECANQDSRVVRLRRAVKGGPAAARNFALAHANGRWIALLDADDAFLPDRLSELIARSETLNADLLADNLILRDFQTGAALGNAYSENGIRFSKPLAVADILIRDMPGSPIYYDRFGYVKPIMRREFIRRIGIRYHEDILAGSDFLFYCECVIRGGRFYLTPGAWYVFSVRADSVSNRPELDRFHSVVNHRIRDLASDHDMHTLQLLERRQKMIDFDCFRSSVLTGDLPSILSFARDLPVFYLVRRIGSSGLRFVVRCCKSWLVVGSMPTAGLAHRNPRNE